MPESTQSPDLRQCITEDIAQYFSSMPKPTGYVLIGIRSYGGCGGSMAETCDKTATCTYRFGCTVTDPKSWCGLSTAVPSSVLSSYSAYLAAVTSYWEANSAAISAHGDFTTAPPPTTATTCRPRTARRPPRGEVLRLFGA
ncbi:hypothetical protein B0T24DRAFT_684773 [Lasiosphaeria ovina]|uniref:DUF7735 domain-containing protein n=1 Tax=Lasiosphaeria ovina TaxID=92902 RepID=A0AAE0MXW6_9PEZI|nr:hypothetical protein B0T24DRAFT_684773 [Lasiosphaeria ovina]